MSDLKSIPNIASLIGFSPVDPVTVKVEPTDDYPVYPTLMDLDPEYAAQVEDWKKFLREAYPHHQEATRFKTSRFQFEFGKIKQ